MTSLTTTICHAQTPKPLQLCIVTFKQISFHRHQTLPYCEFLIPGVFVHMRTRSQKHPAIAAKSTLLIGLIVQLLTAYLSFLRHRWFGHLLFYFFGYLVYCFFFFFLRNK